MGSQRVGHDWATEQQGNNGKVPTNEAGLKARAPSPFALGRLSRWCLSSPPKVISTQSESRSVMSDSLQTLGLYSPWNSLGQNTGVGSLSLLQGIFPTQGLNPGLPHCRQILYQVNHQESPRNTEVGSLSLPHQIFPTQDSNRGLLHAGGFSTSWATREALLSPRLQIPRFLSTSSTGPSGRVS